jgi:hypothetical protein
MYDEAAIQNVCSERELTRSHAQLSQCGQPILYRRGIEHMAKVPPFYSKLPNDRNVYHDNNQCTEGNNIETYNRVSGTGGRPRCEHCARLG